MDDLASELTPDGIEMLAQMSDKDLERLHHEVTVVPVARIMGISAAQLKRTYKEAVTAGLEALRVQRDKALLMVCMNGESAEPRTSV